jgi:hypothetical protein
VKNLIASTADMIMLKNEQTLKEVIWTYPFEEQKIGLGSVENHNESMGCSQIWECTRYGIPRTEKKKAESLFEEIPSDNSPNLGSEIETMTHILIKPTKFKVKESWKQQERRNPSLSSEPQ